MVWRGPSSPSSVVRPPAGSFKRAVFELTFNLNWTCADGHGSSSNDWCPAARAAAAAAAVAAAAALFVCLHSPSGSG